MIKIIFLQLLLLISIREACAQKSPDTTLLIKELDKVMAFSVQPYLYYSGVVGLWSGPMMDTAGAGRTLHNEFYKVRDDLYYGNEQEEIFLQDSLMVRISHSRKTIQLSKVEMATKKRLDILPLRKADMQRMLREHCTLSRLPDAGDTGRIMISTQEKQSPQGFVRSDLLVVYHRGAHLPMSMEITMYVRNEESEQMEELLKQNGFDIAKMRSERDGKRSLSMTRTTAVRFEQIEVTELKASQMPSWRGLVGYDDQMKAYSGKGRCEGYEVIKTF